MYLKQYSEVLLSYCRQGLQVSCIFLLVVPDVLEAAAVPGFVENLSAWSKPNQTFMCVLLFTGDRRHF